jgi:hypothetical protein
MPRGKPVSGRPPGPRLRDLSINGELPRTFDARSRLKGLLEDLGLRGRVSKFGWKQWRARVDGELDLTLCFAERWTTSGTEAVVTEAIKRRWERM